MRDSDTKFRVEQNKDERCFTIHHDVPDVLPSNTSHFMGKYRRHQSIEEDKHFGNRYISDIFVLNLHHIAHRELS